MSHLIEKEDTVYTPSLPLWQDTWHGLQTEVEGKILPDGSNIPNVFNPIIQVGMKPDLDNAELVLTGETAEAMTQAMKAWKLICADCRTNEKSHAILPIHVPKEGYLIHQNRTLFDCMVKAANDVLGDNDYEIVTVGTLGGYSQFFVSIAIKGQESFDVGTTKDSAGVEIKDTWKRFFNLNSSHNGLIASNRMVSMVRMVCMNTVQASIQDSEQAGTISGIKHTKSSGELITPATFAKDLESWLKRSNRFQEMLAGLKGEPMTVETFRNFAAGVFTNSSSDELSTNSYNRIDDLTSLFSRGMGNSGATKYDAINAFTQYFTSGAGTGNPDKVKLNKRVANANFGRGNEWKLQALDMLLDYKMFIDCIKRGKVLLKDKIAVMVTSGDTEEVKPESKPAKGKKTKGESDKK